MTGTDADGRSAPVPSFVSRLEQFATVDSTQRVVRDWLDDGTPEVCVAVADEQTAGRGRQGRSWSAPPGAGLLVSVGFRPADVLIRHAWRLAAVCSLAMAEVAETTAGLPDGTVRLKWPNDLVVEGSVGGLRKLAGVLGETTARDSDAGEPRTATVAVGIGINADWATSDFPPELHASMTSLRALAAHRSIDRDRLLRAWLERLDARYAALSRGAFDADGWRARQVTTGRLVEVDLGDRTIVGLATGVDPDSGGLLVRSGAEGSPTVLIGSGEVVRCRMVPAPA